MRKQSPIKDLAVISDRHSCAILDKESTINWYCPDRFDQPAIFSLILDQKKGGFWSIETKDKVFLNRQFQGRSSVLRSYYAVQGRGLTVTDFMPLNTQIKGICRMFSKSPSPLVNTIKLRGNYGLKSENYLSLSSYCIQIEDRQLFLYTSHPMNIDGELISFTIPQEQFGWAFLGNSADINEYMLKENLKLTIANWEKVEALVDYHGPYEDHVRYSLRALQQMVYQPTGGIIAAATTSLPEVVGGKRNYDYRYVWMRDAALITSSLTQIITTGKLEENFIAFIDGAMKKNGENHVSCFYAIDQSKASDSSELALGGYLNSRPVQIGNSATDQFQLDAEGNILIACSLIYQKFGKVTHWETVNKIADYICKNWERKDNGVWEEEQLQHYTASKAFAARGLELIAPYQKDKKIAERWLENARMIRVFIEENCKTTTGAFAVHAGSQQVDLSAALFVPFGIYEAHSESMLATITKLEADYCDQHLYRRHLLEFNSQEEGAFLAGSCWMAHYYSIAGNLEQSKSILDAVISFSNDLGYFSEEADLKSGDFLGNFPQTFVHSSFICAVNGYKQALSGKTSIVK